MTTSDANGIIFLEETDPIAPFHTLMNTLQQGTSDAITAFKQDSAATRQWSQNRASDGTVGSGTTANNVSLSVPSALPGVYAVKALNKLGQNDATGTLSATLTTPAGSTTVRRSIPASSYADTEQTDYFVQTTTGTINISLTASTSSGSVTAFAGSFIKLTRITDF